MIKSIKSGLAYLGRAQRETGEFPTYASPRLDMLDADAYAKSVYVTAFVIHALGHLPSNPLIPPIRERAGNFLQQEQEEDGAWNYDGRGDWRVPCDLDDTACVVAALAQLGQRPELSFYALLWQNEAAPGGPYYTWIGINDWGDASSGRRARQVDALVNANILFCAGLLGLDLPGTAAYLRQIIEQEAYQDETLYGVSPHFLIYTLSRAYADGGVTALTPAMPSLRDYILTQLPPPQTEASAFNLACLAVSLLNLNAKASTLEAYLSPLLDRQQFDGSWPAWAVYVGYAPDYHGSPALTTALALEALGKTIGGRGAGVKDYALLRNLAPSGSVPQGGFALTRVLGTPRPPGHGPG